MDCIFCKIVNGDIPSLKVFEDEHTMVFMDIAKDVDGHMVAIPKKHVESIFGCDADTLGKLMVTVKKVANHCVDAWPDFEGAKHEIEEIYEKVRIK